MLSRKLPHIIAIELVIGLISFALAGPKAEFGEIAFLLTFGTIIIALSVYNFKRFLNSNQLRKSAD